MTLKLERFNRRLTGRVPGSSPPSPCPCSRRTPRRRPPAPAPAVYSGVPHAQSNRGDAPTHLLMTVSPGDFIGFFRAREVIIQRPVRPPRLRTPHTVAGRRLRHREPGRSAVPTGSPPPFVILRQAAQPRRSEASKRSLPPLTSNGMRRGHGLPRRIEAVTGLVRTAQNPATSLSTATRRRHGSEADRRRSRGLPPSTPASSSHCPCPGRFGRGNRSPPARAGPADRRRGTCR